MIPTPAKRAHNQHHLQHQEENYQQEGSTTREEPYKSTSAAPQTGGLPPATPVVVTVSCGESAFGPATRTSYSTCEPHVKRLSVEQAKMTDELEQQHLFYRSNCANYSFVADQKDCTQKDALEEGPFGEAEEGGEFFDDEGGAQFFEEDDDEEEEEEDYMRLDTIVEEDEESSCANINSNNTNVFTNSSMCSNEIQVDSRKQSKYTLSELSSSSSSSNAAIGSNCDTQHSTINERVGIVNSSLATVKTTTTAGERNQTGAQANLFIHDRQPLSTMVADLNSSNSLEKSSNNNENKEPTSSNLNNNNINNNNNNKRPLAEKPSLMAASDVIVSNSMRKFATSVNDILWKNNTNNNYKQQEEENNTKIKPDNCDENIHSTNLKQVTSVNNSRQQQVLNNTTNNHMQNSRKMLPSTHSSTIPSPKRLISEHQARQQKALFKALAERQKLLDQLNGKERTDLMMSKSTNNDKQNKLNIRKHRRRKRRKRSDDYNHHHHHHHHHTTNNNNNHQRRHKGKHKQSKKHADNKSKNLRISTDEDGVPLSAVDLSSMSDRMLDDLLGHIASASSASSTVSSGGGGESLDSYSDISSASCNSCSCSIDCDHEDGHDSTTSSSYCSSSGGGGDEEDDCTFASNSHRNGRNKISRQSTQQNSSQHSSNCNNRPSQQFETELNILNNAPNVIGIHEDERSRNSTRRSSMRNCRIDAYRRRCDDDDEDNDDKDHELVIDINARASRNAYTNQSSLSPISVGQQNQQSSNNNGLNNNSNEMKRSIEQQNQVSDRDRLSDKESVGSSLPIDSSSIPSSAGACSSIAKPTTTVQQSRQNFALSNNMNINSNRINQITDCKKTIVAAATENATTTNTASTQSVEGVLSRMLEALNEIGSDDQEQLNELLETGFSHLEQLLNCSLTPNNSSATLPNNSIINNNHGQLKTNQKPIISSAIKNSLAQSTISQQQQSAGYNSNGTLSNNINMSKDSDYGSDTQSADCFSQYNETSSTTNQKNSNWLGVSITNSSELNGSSTQTTTTSQSPSPTSLNTSASSSSQNSHFSVNIQNTTKSFSSNVCQTQSNCSMQNSADDIKQSPTTVSALSPLAIELSFKLAESLHRLAQQQQQSRKQQQQETRRFDNNVPLSCDIIEPGTEMKNKTDSSQTKTINKFDGKGEEEEELIAVSNKPAIRQPMKSVVMLNCSSSSSPTSSSSPLHRQSNVSPSIVNKSNRNSCNVSSPTSDSISIIVTNSNTNITNNNNDDNNIDAVITTTTTSSKSSNITALASEDKNHQTKEIIYDSNMKPAKRLTTSIMNPDQVSKSPIRTSTTKKAQAPQPPRQQFKTCVSIGAGNINKQNENERPIVSATRTIAPNETQATARSYARSSIDLKIINDPVDLKQSKEDILKNQDNKNNEEVQIVKVINDKQQHNQVQYFERKRSSRSSLRRRPSFNGSIGGPKEARPGSPVPISILQHQHQQALEAEEEEKLNLTSTMNSSEQHKQQKQLQRALILAQKYNYSPAKLATSKLGSKLQLKDLTSPNNQVQTTILPTARTDESGQQQQRRTATLNGCKALDVACNGQSESTNTILQANNSITRNNQEPIRITGQVELDISYFAKSGSLTVHIMQCTQLAPVSKRRTTSNPYVKLYLLPDKNKSGKRKSIVHRNELNPKFDEKFTFGPALQLADFDEKVLWLSVWHKDRYLSRSDFLGEILLPLSQVRQQLLSSDLCQSTGPSWYRLNERFDPTALTKNRRCQEQQQQPLHLIASNGDCINSLSKTNEQSKQLAASGDGNRSNSMTLGTTTRQFNNNNSKLLSTTTTTNTNGINNNNNLTIKRQTELAKQQAELVDKLNELQRKAAQLTSAVTSTAAPPGGGQQKHNNNSNSNNQNRPLMMNVYLGPKQQHFSFNEQHQSINNNQASVAKISGKLFIALKFLPENGQLISANRVANSMSMLNGELHVMIKEAHNIGGFEAPVVMQNSQQQPTRPLPSGPLPNPFCKCYLLDSNGQRVAKQKTPHLKRTSNPKWDYKCVFTSVKLSKLTCQAIEIQMFNRDSILVSNNEPLGGIRLCLRGDSSENLSNKNHTITTSGSLSNKNASNDLSINNNNGGQGDDGEDGDEQEALCSEGESKLWSQMLARPNIWVYGELRLRLLRPLIAIENKPS